MIFLTGDFHGDIEIEKLSKQNWKNSKKLTKEDYLIILGDFGLIFELQESNMEKYWLNWLNDKPWTTLFIDGNHENFDRLNKYEEVNKFGGVLGKIRDSIFHLKRGNIYTIEGTTFLTFGGARSEDSCARKEFINWWKEELPSYEEYKLCLDNLKKYNNQVDYILTHTAPSSILTQMSKFKNYKWLDFNYEEYQLTKFLEELKNTVIYNKWFFGHMHYDGVINDKFECLYWNIIKLDKYF